MALTPGGRSRCGAPGRQAGTYRASPAPRVFGSSGGLWFLSVALTAMPSGVWAGGSPPSGWTSLKWSVTPLRPPVLCRPRAQEQPLPRLRTGPPLALYFKINLETVPISNTHTIENSNREKSHFYPCPPHRPVEPPPPRAWGGMSEFHTQS